MENGWGTGQSDGEVKVGFWLGICAAWIGFVAGAIVE